MAYRIYCYTNQITGQKYIGCTQKKYQCLRAGSKGCQYVKSCSVFGQAITQYGWNNFKYEVLENNLTKEQSEDREKYWIEKLDTVFPNGYNIEYGGGKKNRVIHDITRVNLSNSHKGHTPGNKGMHWYNNGVVNSYAFECPDGFVPGKLIFKKKAC